MKGQKQSNNIFIQELVLTVFTLRLTILIYAMFFLYITTELQSEKIMILY